MAREYIVLLMYLNGDIHFIDNARTPAITFTGRTTYYVVVAGNKIEYTDLNDKYVEFYASKS